MSAAPLACMFCTHSPGCWAFHADDERGAICVWCMDGVPCPRQKKLTAAPRLPAHIWPRVAFHVFQPEPHKTRAKRKLDWFAATRRLEDGRLFSIALERALLAMPGQLRSALVMRNAYGFEFKEMAHLWNIGTNTARCRCLRAHAHLAAQLFGAWAAVPFLDMLHKAQAHRSGATMECA